MLLSISCVSCATVKTVNPEEGHVDISYGKNKCQCGSIPRVYSGAAYNFCRLHGEPRTEPAYEFQVLNGVPFLVIDTFFSVLADTVLLPYTVYRQVNDGNIQVN